MSDKEKKDISRRSFIKGASLAVGGAALGGGLVGSLGLDKGRNPNHSDQEKDISENHYNKALMYFTPEQFKITEFEET